MTELCVGVGGEAVSAAGEFGGKRRDLPPASRRAASNFQRSAPGAGLCGEDARTAHTAIQTDKGRMPLKYRGPGLAPE